MKIRKDRIIKKWPVTFCDSCLKSGMKVSLVYGLSTDQLYCYLCDDCIEKFGGEELFENCANCGCYLCGSHGYPQDTFLYLQEQYCLYCRNELIYRDAVEENKRVVDEIVKEIETMQEQAKPKRSLGEALEHLENVVKEDNNLNPSGKTIILKNLKLSNPINKNN